MSFDTKSPEGKAALNQVYREYKAGLGHYTDPTRLLKGDAGDEADRFQIMAERLNVKNTLQFDYHPWAFRMGGMNPEETKYSLYRAFDSEGYFDGKKPKLDKVKRVYQNVIAITSFSHPLLNATVEAPYSIYCANPTVKFSGTKLSLNRYSRLYVGDCVNVPRGGAIHSNDPGCYMAIIDIEQMYDEEGKHDPQFTSYINISTKHSGGLDVWRLIDEVIVIAIAKCLKEVFGHDGYDISKDVGISSIKAALMDSATVLAKTGLLGDTNVKLVDHPDVSRFLDVKSWHLKENNFLLFTPLIAMMMASTSDNNKLSTIIKEEAPKYAKEIGDTTTKYITGLMLNESMPYYTIKMSVREGAEDPLARPNDPLQPFVLTNAEKKEFLELVKTRSS